MAGRQGYGYTRNTLGGDPWAERWRRERIWAQEILDDAAAHGVEIELIGSDLTARKEPAIS
jgi:hypothetical protein